MYWYNDVCFIGFRKIHLHKAHNIDPENCAPGVSIAKPLCSATDPNLSDNLSTYFELDYPTVNMSCSGRWCNSRIDV